MKLRRMFFLLVLLLGQIGSVSTDAWMIWNHLRDFHGVEHVCRHECDVCLANGDASHRQHHAPVAVLPPFRSQSVPDAASLPAHPAYRTRRKIPLDVAPFILHKGLRAPPVMA